MLTARWALPTCGQTRSIDQIQICERGHRLQRKAAPSKPVPASCRTFLRTPDSPLPATAPTPVQYRQSQPALRDFWTLVGNHPCSGRVQPRLTNSTASTSLELLCHAGADEGLRFLNLRRRHALCGFLATIDGTFVSGGGRDTPPQIRLDEVLRHLTLPGFHVHQSRPPTGSVQS